MNRPTISDFDQWKLHPVTAWYEEYRQEQADMLAGENGRRIGTADNKGLDHMMAVRNAGFVAGIEDTISHDPFSLERGEMNDAQTNPDR